MKKCVVTFRSAKDRKTASNILNSIEEIRSHSIGSWSFRDSFGYVFTLDVAFICSTDFSLFCDKLWDKNITCKIELIG